MFRKEFPLIFSSGVLCQSPLLMLLRDMDKQKYGQLYDEVTRLHGLKQNLIRIVMNRNRLC